MTTVTTLNASSHSVDTHSPHSGRLDQKYSPTHDTFHPHRVSGLTASLSGNLNQSKNPHREVDSHLGSSTYKSSNHGSDKPYAPSGTTVERPSASNSLLTCPGNAGNQDVETTVHDTSLRHQCIPRSTSRPTAIERDSLQSYLWQSNIDKGGTRPAPREQRQTGLWPEGPKPSNFRGSQDTCSVPLSNTLFSLPTVWKNRRQTTLAAHGCMKQHGSAQSGNLTRSWSTRVFPGRSKQTDSVTFKPPTVKLGDSPLKEKIVLFESLTRRATIYGYLPQSFGVGHSRYSHNTGSHAEKLQADRPGRVKCAWRRLSSSWGQSHRDRKSSSHTSSSSSTSFKLTSLVSPGTSKPEIQAYGTAHLDASDETISSPLEGSGTRTFTRSKSPFVPLV